MKNAIFSAFFLDKEVENLDEYACPKTRDLVLSEADEEICICLSYTFRHKTTIHCAERKPKLLGNWAMQQLRL